MSKYGDIFEPGLTKESIETERKLIPSVNIMAESVKESGIPRTEAKLFDLDRVDKLIEGAIDTHIHSGPDPNLARLGDPVEFAIEACDAGFAAVLFKTHYYPSTAVAKMAERIANEWAKENGKKKIDVFGGVVLNYHVGGLNPEAVIASARIGGKIVWPPNVNSKFWHKRVGLPGGIELIDENDNVVPEMMEILKLIAEGDLALFLSSISVRERFILIDEAVKMGIKRISVIHPNQPNSKMTVQQMKIAADKGAWIELTCYDFSYPEFEWDEFMEAYNLIGPDKMIAATDQGNFYGYRPVAAMKRFVTQMLYRGIPDKDVEKMIKKNPRELLY